jgi:hypothetical protein
MKMPSRPRQPTQKLAAVEQILSDTSVSYPIDDGLAVQQLADTSE